MKNYKKRRKLKWKIGKVRGEEEKEEIKNEQRNASN